MKKLLEQYELNKTMGKLDHDICSIFPPNCYSIDNKSIIQSEILKKCGYFGKHPDYIMSIAGVEQNKISDVIKKDCIEYSDLSANDLLYLSPATCLHIFPLLADSQLGENIIISSKSICYRKEENYVNGIRLNEFTLREIIFIGYKNFVITSIDNMKNRVVEYAKSIDKNTTIVDAYDNFLPSHFGKIMGKIQQSNKTKQELLMNVHGEKIACSSFNYHNDEFAKMFNIGENIFSGCVGSGLERWVSAYMCARNIK